MGKKGIKLISMRRENKLNNNDNIKSPKHYKLEGLNVESIEVIKSVLGQEGFKAFCKGNTMKYLIRAEKKNGLEDYKKAKTYLDWYLRECESND
nr:MAG TPA: nucelotide kinase [Caudoviricetes sp.]